jgi:hypothetical protein
VRKTFAFFLAKLSEVHPYCFFGTCDPLVGDAEAGILAA